MKIVFISRYQGKVERGVENYVSELASRLETSGHEVEILTSAWQLLRNQKRLGPNIIYPLNGYWQTLGCRLYSWLTGAKLVVGGHAGIGRDDRWNLYMFPDLFIAFSQKGFDWARKVNPFVNIVKIPHGVDLKKFSPRVKPVKLYLEHPIFITVFGTLLPYKRIGETIKAVAMLKKGSLILVGEHPEEKTLKELGQKLLGPQRFLRLKVFHHEVARYLRAADVFTLVSEESEAFGLVYLEAMACGLPVVATDDSLRHELIGDHAAIRLSAESRRAGAGVFVKNPEDSQEYAGCLEAAAKRDWGDKPVRQAKKFDWERIDRKYLEEFKEL